MSEIVLDESRIAGNTSHRDNIRSNSSVIAFRTISESADGNAYIAGIYIQDRVESKGVTDNYSSRLEGKDAK